MLCFHALTPYMQSLVELNVNNPPIQHMEYISVQYNTNNIIYTVFRY